MELSDMLSGLCASYGPSGDEGPVREHIRALAEPYADEISVDALGSLLVHRKGSGARVLFAAHMDTIGFVVTHIESSGFLRVGRLGGLDPAEVVFSPVVFRSGARGVLLPEEKAKREKLRIDECYVDVGASSAEEARKIARVGDTCVLNGMAVPMGGRFACRHLDNRVSCAVLLSVLASLAQGEGSPNDLWFVFSVQEEVGTRGIQPAAFAVDPDWGLAVDVTDVGDTPGTKRDGTCALGKGAGIKILDRSVISHPQVVQTLTDLARQNGIPVQRDIMKDGGTDAGPIHRTRMGVRSGGISVPCRGIHTPVETVDLGDAEACVKLALAFARAPLEVPRP